MNKKADFLAKIIDFKGLKIKLASPAEILSWSHGEVLKPETINYRTLKPEKDGLFCEKIFGPTKDWECYCGKYKRIRYKGIICDKCGVEVTQSKVRRERMGHITLASPVCHVWYFKGNPSKLSLFLDVSPKDLESVIYFAQYLVLEVNQDKKKEGLKTLNLKLAEKLAEIKKEFEEEKKKLDKEEEKEKKEIKNKIGSKEARDLALNELNLKYKKRLVEISTNLNLKETQNKEIFKTLSDLVKKIKVRTVLTEEEYLKLDEYRVNNFFKIGMGGEAILSILRSLDLNQLAAELKEEVIKTTSQRHIKAIKRLRLVEGIRKAGLRPEWTILTVLPVIPPDLRPMVQLTGGRFATSDLNDLYRRVINRNNRLKHLISLGAPEIILRNEKRMLQEAVDSLIDTSQRANTKVSPLTKKLRSLSDMLRGKQGRFRQNLLGKRVDYSGRSVIVVGPELRLQYCGLPKEMVLEMFKPFVLRELIIRGLAPNVKNAKNVLEKRPPEVWDILEDITKDHPVLLNRAPTLHKLGIQAFYPILIEGNAIRIHPCVCAGYNADFDGDQMAVHIPLSGKAKEEAVKLIMSNRNLLKPADGSPITVPNKEMALGCFYVTSIEEKEELKKENNEKIIKVFSDEKEAILAFQEKKLALRELVKVRINKGIIETTVGRLLFNEVLPEKLRFVNENIKASTIKSLLIKALDLCTNEEVVSLIDGLKDLGFWGATLAGGVSVSLFDCEILTNKDNYLKEADQRVSDIEKNYRQGLITKEELRRLSNNVWIEVTEKVADLTWDNLAKNNSVKIIIDSGGARASKDQLKQLSAMRGLAVDPLGNIVPLPTKSNFRQGLSIFEYVTATRGSRKGLTDSALKTADAGYLTRRLVDVAHDVIVREDDCGVTEGIEISTEQKRSRSFYSRILGRILAKKLVNPKSKKVILKEGEEINEKNVYLLKEAGITKVMLRSPLTCQTKHGICQKCYGRDLGTKELVEIGTPAGVIAAQSIGEPGTQLTMRVRHSGGIVGLDVTQGLPRVEELFEARTPKLLSPIAEIAGVVGVEEITEGYKIIIKSKTRPVEEREYFVPATSELAVSDGDLVANGTQLATGYLDIKKVLEVRGYKGAQQYLIEEIQRVYESQGIPIDDKHFEIMIRKMSEKVRVETSGDTSLLPGEFVNKDAFTAENARVISEGGEPATAELTIIGITKAALLTDSWLSAASFEQTTNVLGDSAVSAKEDYLLGLKENVIIGRLIPTSPDRVKI